MHYIYEHFGCVYLCMGHFMYGNKKKKRFNGIHTIQYNASNSMNVFPFYSNFLEQRKYFLTLHTDYPISSAWQSNQ